MTRLISALAIGSLLTAPALAGNDQRMRQLSEVVFANYPPGALARGEQGAVYFLVTLDKDAHATSCKVTYGSGHPLLDEETCDLIVQHAVFNKLKDANGRVTRETQEGVVYWRIPGAPQPSVAPVALTPASAPEERICKRSLRTGSLADFQRTCMTAAEWSRQADDMKQMFEDIQGKKGLTACDFAGVAEANHPGGDQTPAPGSGGTC
ncbi:MAG: energy transducer TonB [Sphingomonas sp.]|nr:energy transducer TonB [Sphingomonas sp.]MBW0007008.1 energy transducer TonB [Sphingomonas sp.]